MNRKDFQELSRLRLIEAKTLLKNGQYSGAYYLAGYSIECALKARIAKSIRRYDFPEKKKTNDSYEHGPIKLVGVANLDALLKSEISRDAEFEKRWALVKNWSEQTRYQIFGSDEAKDMIEALTNVKHGVLRWIKLHW